MTKTGATCAGSPDLRQQPGVSRREERYWDPRPMLDRISGVYPPPHLQGVHVPGGPREEDVITSSTSFSRVAHQAGSPSAAGGAAGTLHER